MIKETEKLIANISKYLFSIYTKLTSNLSKGNFKNYIYIYIIIVIVSFCYLLNYRKFKIIERDLKNSENNTKRNAAIEKFKNFKTTALKSLEENCSTVDNLIDNKSKSLPKKIKSNNVNIKNDKDFDETIKSNNLFINSNLLTLLENNVNFHSQNDKKLLSTLKNVGVFLINDKIESLTNKINNYLKKNINNINYNNYYVKEDDILCFLDDDCKINDTQKLSLELNELIKKINNDLLDLNIKYNENYLKNEINASIRKEVYTRLYKKIEILGLKEFKKMCSLSKKIKDLQHLINSDSYEKISNENKDLYDSKYSYLDSQSRYQIYLITLSKLTENEKDIQLLKKQRDFIKSNLIQPRNENEISQLNQLSNQLNNPYNVQSKDGEIDLTKQYSEAYKKYQDEVKEKNLGLNPINILSDIESKTIDFLSNINEKLFKSKEEFNNVEPDLDYETNANYSNNHNENNKIRDEYYYKQPNHVGKYLIPGNKNKITGHNSQMSYKSINNDKTNDNIDNETNDKIDNETNGSNYGNYIKDSNNSIEEGFQNYNARNTNIENFSNYEKFKNTKKSKKSDNLEEGIEDYIKYAYDKIKSFLPKEKVKMIENIIFDEKNMVPLGSLLIIVSVILFFISITS